MAVYAYLDAPAHPVQLPVHFFGAVAAVLAVVGPQAHGSSGVMQTL